MWLLSGKLSAIRNENVRLEVGREDPAVARAVCSEQPENGTALTRRRCGTSVLRQFEMVVCRVQSACHKPAASDRWSISIQLDAMNAHSWSWLITHRHSEIEGFALVDSIPTRGCSPSVLLSTGGNGLLYCFAER